MRGQSVTMPTELPPAAAIVWWRVCIIVCAHNVFFHSQSIFFLFDSDLGTGQIYRALLSAPGPRTAHYTAGIWTFFCASELCWDIMENRDVCTVWF